MRIVVDQDVDRMVYCSTYERDENLLYFIRKTLKINTKECAHYRTEEGNLMLIPRLERCGCGHDCCGCVCYESEEIALTEQYIVVMSVIGKNL